MTARTSLKPYTKALPYTAVLAVLKQKGRCTQYELADYVLAAYPDEVKPERAYANVGAALRYMNGWKVKKIGFADRHPAGGRARTIWEAV